MTSRHLLTVAALAVLAGGLAACSSGGPAAPSAAPAAATRSAGTNLEQQALAVGRRFGQCGRDHGFPDFPDPVIDRGKLGYPNAPQETRDQERQVLAIPECKAILGETPQLPDNRPAPSAADLRKLRDFAHCMREHGIPEWPDPKSDGTFPILGTPIQTEAKKSQRFLTATEACRQYWDKGIDPS
jgi:hypothetical protein